MPRKQGGCLCGNLRYEVKRQPERTTICHCTFCQRATGGAYLVEPIYQTQDFAVIAGDPATFVHVSAGSGKEVTVHFCSACGTKLFLTFERYENTVGVFGGTADDPDWMISPPSQTKHIFLSNAQRGTLIPAHVATYQEHATQNNGTPISPTYYDFPKVIGD